MRLLLLSDTHIRASVPVGRTDDYLEAQWNKWKFLFDTALEQNVEGILHAGDFFDKPDPPYFLVNKWIQLWAEYKIPIYVVKGQHDLYMRNQDINKTVLGLLEVMGIVHIISSAIEVDNVEIHGISYGEK